MWKKLYFISSYSHFVSLHWKQHHILSIWLNTVYKSEIFMMSKLYWEIVVFNYCSCLTLEINVWLQIHRLFLCAAFHHLSRPLVDSLCSCMQKKCNMFSFSVVLFSDGLFSWVSLCKPFSTLSIIRSSWQWNFGITQCVWAYWLLMILENVWKAWSLPDKRGLCMENVFDIHHLVVSSSI